MSSAYVIDPPVQISLPVTDDTRRFAVNRIYCVGRNYADHAREMGHDPDREPPFFFMKPANSIVTDGKDMAYPNLSNDVHHEIEMVVAIGKGGANISANKALDHVYGYGVGLDMTRRDLQGEVKKMGRSWDTGKAFDQSAPCGEITSASQCGHPSQGAVTLLVNGEVRQSGDPQSAHLECARHDCVFIHLVYFRARRPHFLWHTSRRRSREKGRCTRR
jgi:fumarylpyruvate hydrolase